MSADVPRPAFTPALALWIAAGAAAIGITLAAFGQPWICTCGTVRLWVGSVFSSENSQQVADWYSLSHAVHGMLVILIGRLAGLGRRDGLLFAAALATGVAWEIVEHTDFVLDRFRATTIYQGYVGDSVLNAVSDYGFMFAGFFAARALPSLAVIATILALEATSTVVARDSLTLTTISVLHPVQAISDWQQELNPNPRPRD